MPFAYVNSNVIPLFAQIGIDGALFGPLIEKLWAKLNGSYERVQAGWQHEALRVLSGAPASDYLCSAYTSDQIWSLISDAD